MKAEEWKELGAVQVGLKNMEKSQRARFLHLMGLTRQEDEHPEGYDGPCACRTCDSYAF